VSAALLEVRNLRKLFPIRGGLLNRVVGNVQAVQDATFTLGRGEIVGLVGESGSGKSTLGRSILRLTEPTSGEVLFDGRDVLALRGHEMRRMRREMQIVFQDPFASLDPRMTIEAIIGEPLSIHKLASRAERPAKIAELLELVGLSAGYRKRYPHQFSGGQRQRIGIARALAVKPSFIVADEPVSALDVSVQAQIVNLIQDLQQRLGLTMLFIAHDLPVVEHLCDRVMVMYLGRIMELAPSRRLYGAPKHPYTEALLSAAPIPDPARKRERILLAGDIPSPVNPPSGCVFRTRCPYAIPECAQTVPPLREVAPGHYKACIRDVL
jgi:peptide/nickel transport system ATP-binding protein